MAVWWWALACSEQGLVDVDDDVVGTPALVVAPERLDFGAPFAGELVSRPLTLTNAGGATLGIDDVAVEVGFALDAPPPTELLAGDSVTLDVFYTSTGQPRLASALIASNDPGDPVVGVPIDVGAAPGALTLSPDPVDFGAVGLGARSEQVVTFENTGGADILVSDVVVEGGPVGLSGGPGFPAVLRPGASWTLNLGWRPVDWTAPLAARLVVTHDAASSNAPVDVIGEVSAGGLAGEICEPDGSPAEGARVWVAIDLDEDGYGETIVESLTDAAGRFSLVGLPLGDVEVNVKKGRYATTIAATVLAGGGVTELPAPECLEAKDLAIAVVPGYFDDVGGLLDDLGVSYTLERPALFTSLSALSAYDVVFAPCDGVTSANVSAVRAFVQGGGGLYVSDYSLLAFEKLYPDTVSFSSDSYAGPTTGLIADSALAAAVGSASVSLAMDTGVSFAFADADPSVDAEVLLYVDRPTREPVIVRVRDGDGTVVFTSFHTSGAFSPAITRLFGAIVADL